MTTILDGMKLLNAFKCSLSWLIVDTKQQKLELGILVFLSAHQHAQQLTFELTLHQLVHPSIFSHSSKIYMFHPKIPMFCPAKSHLLPV
jgi:Ni,Fe-hydrogenase maturation factor